MATDQVAFYLRHRGQISEWAKLEKRVDGLMRDAVEQGEQDKAVMLLRGDSGDPEVDFHVRNRSLISQWDSLQTAAGEALHASLVEAAREGGLHIHQGKQGWTEVRLRSPEFEALRDERSVHVELVWTKQDLLSTRRGYPFPRLALVLPPATWQGASRNLVVTATRVTAHDLGMKKKVTWWVHWGMLDAIAESQDPRNYADGCIAKLQEASVRLYPVLLEAISTAPVRL